MASEHILCAAIYVDTGKAEPPRRSHTYPATGLVFAGWRHPDCFVLLEAWSDRMADEEHLQTRGVDQGFLTSTGRYVSRREAWQIAVTAGQVQPGTRTQDPLLYSEDLC